MAFIGKENRNIKQSLKDEYKSFANLLIKNIASKCEIDNFSRESINQILLILQEGQNAGKPFKDVIPEPYETVNETVKALKPKPKKYFLKLTAGFSLASAVIIFAVLYFSLWMPVVLEKPIISFNEASGAIQWQQIANAQEYEIIINGETCGTTKYNYYYLTDKVNSKTFQVSVKPLSKGRYKTKNDSIGYFSGELKGKNYTVDYNAYELGGCPEDGEYRGFLFTETEPDAFGRFVVKYKPKYGGYYEISCYDAKMIEITVGSSSNVEFDNITTEQGHNAVQIYLNGGHEYSFTFSVENVNSWWSYYVSFKLCMFDVESSYIINPGTTIFALNFLESWVKYAEAYKAPEGIEFNYIDGNYTSLNFDTFCLINNDGESLFAVNNTTNNPITVGSLKKNIVNINNASGTLTLKKGYTTIEIGANIEIGRNPYLPDDKKLCFYTLDRLTLLETSKKSKGEKWVEGSRADGYNSYSGFIYSDIDFGDSSTKLYTTIFCYEDIELEYVYGALPVISGFGEKEVPFGFFRIYPDWQLSLMRILQGSLYEFSLVGNCFNGTGALSTITLLQYGGYTFFQPYKKPAVITISSITA